MSTAPKVTITELDGALGVLPPSAGRPLAVIGPTIDGVLNQPAAFARVKDLVSSFKGGPAVEAAARFIDVFGRPVVIVRSATSVAAGASTIRKTLAGASTADVAVGSTVTPTDYSDVKVRIVKGGTVGTAGITYETSLNGGRDYDGVKELGTADEIAVGGVTFELDEGTFAAGDSFSVATTPAESGTAELATALDALINSAQPWEIVELTTPMDATVIDLVEQKIGGAFGRGKYRAWIGNTRIPAPGETEAAYKTALDAALGTKATVLGSLYSGAAKVPSSVTGKQVRRPVSFITAAEEASVDEHINIAAPARGPLRGVSIRDVNGNPDEHDEAINPGLDASRFGTLTTIEGYEGVYVTRPRIFAPSGSDFQIMPYRRVLNLAHDTLRIYFTKRLNLPILVDRATGLILESEALEIELGARAALRTRLMAAPKASAVDFVLSRVDQLLSNKTLTGQGRVTPLSYSEFINLDVGFFNPAAQLVYV